MNSEAIAGEPQLDGAIARPAQLAWRIRASRFGVRPALAAEPADHVGAQGIEGDEDDRALLRRRGAAAGGQAGDQED